MVACRWPLNLWKTQFPQLEIGLISSSWVLERMYAKSWQSRMSLRSVRHCYKFYFIKKMKSPGSHPEKNWVSGPVWFMLLIAPPAFFLPLCPSHVLCWLLVELIFQTHIYQSPHPPPFSFQPFDKFKQSCWSWSDKIVLGCAWKSQLSSSFRPAQLFSFRPLHLFLLVIKCTMRDYQTEHLDTSVSKDWTEMSSWGCLSLTKQLLSQETTGRFTPLDGAQAFPVLG